jgi:hypothetical protein
VTPIRHRCLFLPACCRSSLQIIQNAYYSDIVYNLRSAVGRPHKGKSGVIPVLAIILSRYWRTSAGNRSPKATPSMPSDCARADHRTQALFVDLVTAGERQAYWPKRQPDALRLAPQQICPDRMHRHTIELLIDCCKQASQFNIGLLAQQVQRPGALLAATPRKQNPFFSLSSLESHVLSSTLYKSKE